MIDTILFDLDGTLLQMDTGDFVKKYYYELGVHFKDMIDSELLVKHINTSFFGMVKDESDETNETVFNKHFKEIIGDDFDIYIERFLEFYSTSFDKVNENIVINKTIVESIKLLKDKGYKIICATNPVFPQISTYKRIKWAGLDPSDFDLITTYENSTSCKPNIKYYQEILSKINKEPSQCIMVGNDALEDMVAGKLGIKTYLITDFLHNAHNIEVKADYISDFNEFYEFSKELPIIKK